MAKDRIMVGVTEAQKRQIRAAAGREDMSMSEFCREQLEEWLEENADDAIEQ